MINVIIRHLNEIPIRISKVNRHNCSLSTSPLYRPFFYLYSKALHVLNDTWDRHSSNKANVNRTWCWIWSFWFKLIPFLMQVEFLISKGEGFPTLSKCYFIHSKYLGVEFDSGLYVRNCQHDMVNMWDRKLLVLFNWLMRFGTLTCENKTKTIYSLRLNKWSFPASQFMRFFPIIQWPQNQWHKLLFCTTSAPVSCGKRVGKAGFYPMMTQ